MKKYWHVFINTFSEISTYRFNFAMWRFRNVLQVLTLYFLWSTVIPQQSNLFGYSHEQILTYVIGTSFLSAIIMSTRAQEIGDNIVNGDLSIFLLRPWGYFKYWLARDLGDKLMNILFSIGEIIILVLLLNPPLFIQVNAMLLILTCISVIIAVLLHFLISALMSMLGFWSNDVWAPRFMFYVISGFLTGAYFPLDIFPTAVYNFFQILPFTYLIYFPMKMYLGQLSTEEITNGFFISFIWLIILFVILRIIWIKGIKMYEAVGR